MTRERADLTWGDDGVPRSTRFGDVYFSSGEGLAETEAVFLRGCGLPQDWTGREHFTLAELGFGTGLNIAAALDLWRRTASPTARLSLFTVEAFPMRREEAARALGAWPQIAEAAQALLEQWPHAGRGFQRLWLPDFRATLDVAVMEAAEALKRWCGRADAWFLDGFSPATNPQMWREAVLRLVAERSAPGARAASFTVAGAVRRGLAEAGFAVEKAPGHGRKRERLEARFPGVPAEAKRPQTIAIIGAGIAGVALARALRLQGVEPLLIEAEAPGAGASGNAAALVTPRLDAGGGAVAQFYAQAFDHAVRLYEGEAPEAVLSRGVIRLESGPRDPRRFEAIAGQDFFAEGSLARLTAGETTALAGEPAPAGLRLGQGLVVDPAALLQRWTGPVRRGRVEAIERWETGRRLMLADGGSLKAEAVVIAAGWGASALWPGLELRPVRGQASLAAGEPRQRAFTFGAYAIPAPGGVMFGATHDRGRTDTAHDPADDQRNRSAVAKVLPRLAARLGDAPTQGRASIRATTADHLPVAGALEEGLFILGGLGSRGFCTAPLAAEHVAALIMGRPSPLPGEIAGLLDPVRSTGQG